MTTVIGNACTKAKMELLRKKCFSVFVTVQI